MALDGSDRKSGLICNDVIAAVMMTLTLMTSRLVNAADSLDVGRQWRGHHGRRPAVTWYDDVTVHQHNSVLQRDDPTKLDEVNYSYYGLAARQLAGRRPLCFTADAFILLLFFAV